MRTRQRPGRTIHQTCQTLGRIPAQPLMHRLPSNPMPTSNISHRRPIVHDLEHGLIALFHDAELHDHQRDPLDPDEPTCPSPRRLTAINKQTCQAATGVTVAQLPESRSADRDDRGSAVVVASLQDHDVVPFDEVHEPVFLVDAA